MAEPVSNMLYNSARWDGFAFRDGDIVISTPAKCGTTWTQRIVSLLVFDSTELYAPMARISPWLDMNTRPLDDVVAELDAQTHRRFIKSHLALDLLPRDDRVTYITVGRDPRDVAISMAHHMDNIDFDKFIGERIAAVGAEDLVEMKPEDMPDMSGGPIDRFWRWVEEPTGNDGLGGVVNHLKSYWDQRDDPNVVLLHYDDLQRDLVGQMAYLARRLGIDRSAERLEELAPAATFWEMKAAAESTAPNGDQTFWKSADDFFHTGTSGQWRDLMPADEVPRYEA
ncbi:MAG: aryl sulfotransferase, partial [Actinomycetota bacterium]